MKLYEITEQLENIKELLENPEFADNEKTTPKRY